MNKDICQVHRVTTRTVDWRIMKLMVVTVLSALAQDTHPLRSNESHDVRPFCPVFQTGATHADLIG